MDDLGVVEDQQGVGWEEFGDVEELALAYLAVLVYEEFGLVASFEGEFGYAFVGKGIVEVGYLDVFGAIHWLGVSFGLRGKVGCTTG